MEIFRGIIGQIEALTFLTAMIEKKRLGQSLLFSGPPSVGKAFIADQFAHHLAATADVHRFAPEGKTSQYSIDSVRELSNQVHLSAFGPGRSIYILEDAHQMPPPAANALLKTFEEPMENAVIVLLTSNAGELLPTIFSRCVKVPFKGLAPCELAEILRSKNVELPSDAFAEKVMEFGRASFALRSAEGSAKERLELFSKLLLFPIDYPTFHRTLRELEKAMYHHLDEMPRSSLNEKRWRDAAATAREQLQRALQARAQSELQEEIEFFSSNLLDQVNRGTAADQDPWMRVPALQLARDLQRLLKLWQRGGRISQLLEALFLNWRFIEL